MHPCKVKLVALSLIGLSWSSSVNKILAMRQPPPLAVVFMKKLALEIVQNARQYGLAAGQPCLRFPSLLAISCRLLIL